MNTVRSPLQAQIVQWLVASGDAVQAGDLLLVLEAMKMEHELRAERAGRVSERFFAEGETVDAGAVLLRLDPLTPQQVVGSGVGGPASGPVANGEPPGPRDDLRRLQQRLAHTLDEARPEAVARRHALGLRTARENIADLCDDDSFLEYGALAVAAQRSRRSEDDLIANTPADGMVTGIGSVNGHIYGAGGARPPGMAPG